MALESATYLSGLVASNPSAGDPITQSDDHLRLIKAALTNSFPTVTGAVTSTLLQLNSPIPTGLISLWAGSILTVPTGWGLCDGSTYSKADGSGSIASPNLRDRFVVGAGTTYAVAATGGSNTPPTATGASGAHTPAGTLATGGSHSHGGTTGSTVLNTTQIPTHTHTVPYTTQAFGSGGGAPAGYNGSTTSGNTTSSSSGGGLGHDHTITADTGHTHAFTGTAVVDHTHSMTVSLPAYYALAFIMKL